MLDVILALFPAAAAACLYFRLRAPVLIAACVVSAVFTEWFCNVLRRRPKPASSLGDLSAVLTGFILALSLPPALPVWAAVVGSCFAIAVGKMVFGGLGANIFNPAMVGRTFLTASFGVLMTTWTFPADAGLSEPGGVGRAGVDSVTCATPLAASKDAIKAGTGAGRVNSRLSEAFAGRIGGCLGETSGLAIAAGGLYLLLRGSINIHIPAAVILSSLFFSGIAYLANPDAYISPAMHLASGGMLLCAFFIATDPVTSPLSVRGMWLFGAGIGAVTMLIRIVGEYPEGVMFAVLLMNAVTPLIDRLCRIVPAGGRPVG
jgi:electron transport complex protein RnfD